MKRVILTGSTGLIGSMATPFLEERGFEVVPLLSHECNLFDEKAVSQFVSDAKAEYLLHFAWITGGDYLTNPINYDYREASFRLFREFQKNEGKRAVFAGTCFEYDFSKSVLCENDKLNPKTLYAEQKVLLCRDCMEYAKENDVQFAWGRIFYVYGANEKTGRLTADIIENLQNDMPVKIKYGQLKKDYMYSKEIARAFATILDNDICGPINVCTGKSISLADYATTVARKMGKEHLLDIRYEETEQPMEILGNPDRLLNDVGFEYQYNLESAFDEIL